MTGRAWGKDLSTARREEHIPERGKRNKNKNCGKSARTAMVLGERIVADLMVAEAADAVDIGD